MATYTFDPVPVYGQVGGLVRLGASPSTTLPVTDLSDVAATVTQGGATQTGYLTTDRTGLIPPFTTTDIESVMVTLSPGVRVRVDSREALRRPLELAAQSPALEPLRAALAAADRSCAVQVLGDSTGDATNEWVYLLGQSLATAHPEYTVQYRAWDDTAQDYLAPTTIQTGTAGPLAMVVASGTQTRRLAGSVSPHISGPIDVRLKMALSDWTPATTQQPIGKTDAAGSRGWYCGINNTASGNRPYFVFSTDGTALTTMTVIGSPTVADGATIWMRWVFTPNDGAGNRTLAAYQSTDGVTWTQIGATVTTAGAVTVFNNSTVGYSLGGEASGANAVGATIYEVEVRDGVNGPSVVPALPDLWTRNPVSTASTIAVTGAPVLTLVNGSKAGANIAYWADTTRIKKANRDYGQTVRLLSIAHNQGAASRQAFTAEFDPWRAQVDALTPTAPTVVLTQNPERAAAVNTDAQAQRRRDLIAYARQKGLGLVDTYQGFLDNPAWASTLMLDDIHPNAAGSAVWRDTVLAAIGS